MKININKTKTMIISRDEKNRKIKIGDQTLEQVKQFKYLGSIINNNCRIDEKINNRIIAGGGKLYYMLSGNFISRKEVTNKTKLTVYKTTYRTKYLLQHMNVRYDL